MDYIKSKIIHYIPLNSFEMLLKYTYENGISFDEIDFDSPKIRKLLIAEKNLSVEETRRKYKMMFASAAANQNISTNAFIPDGRSLYIRKFPRYLSAPPHAHSDAMEINIVLQGVFFQKINGNTIKLKAGDICFVAPNTPHYTQTNDDASIVLSIIVYQEILRNILNDVTLSNNDLGLFLNTILFGSRYYPFMLCDTHFDIDIVGMVIDMENHQDIPGSFTDRFMETELKILMLRILMMHNDHIILGNNLEKNNSGIMDILEYIEYNSATVTLKSLSETYNYSVSYLSSLIREQYGRSFTEILTDFKLNSAIRLLRNTNYSMSKISELIGYSDKSYFLRKFRQKYKMTPTEYRTLSVSDNK